MFDLSNKLDPFTLEVLSHVTDAASSLNIEFFIVGASARDIILEELFSIKSYRATNDIDFSVRVRTWDEYSKLINKLCDLGFSKTNIIHKFTYKSIPGIDIIPFGKIAANSKSIEWPDKQTKEMSVIGFEECFADSELIKFRQNPDLIVKVASLRGLIIMKLISWKDGFPARSRDAQDIFYILKNYIDAGNSDRLFNLHSDLVNDSFDYELSGSILAGRDIKEIARQNTINFLKDLLSEEINKKSQSQLLKDMSSAFFPFEDPDKKDSISMKLLSNLFLGLT